MFVHMFTTSSWPIWDDLNIWTSPEVSHLYVRKTSGLMSSLHQRWLKHDNFTVGDLDPDTPTPSTPRSSEKTSRSESGRPWFVVGIKKTNILPVRHEHLTFGTLCQVQERNFTGSRILRMFGQFVKSLWHGGSSQILSKQPSFQTSFTASIVMSCHLVMAQNPGTQMVSKVMAS